MFHLSGGDVFQVSASVLRRVEKKARDLLDAGNGFYKTVVGLVIQLEAAIFHRDLKGSYQPSVKNDRGASHMKRAVLDGAN
jgi:hypothetical protein